MSDNSTFEPQDAPLVVSAHFGQPLRQAREARELSVDDIVDTLHINKQYIDGIEAEDMQALPQPAFVRGYIRNYANYLDIDCAPLLAAYNHSIGDVPDENVVSPRARLTPIRQKKANPTKKIALTAALFAGLAFVSWAVWQAFQGDDAPETVATAAWQDWVSSEVDERGDALDVLNPELAGDSERLENAANQASATTSAVTAPDVVANGETQSTTTLTASELAQSSADQDAMQTDLQAANDMAAVVNTTDTSLRTQIITANEEPVIISDNRLSLEAAQNAWVQIKQGTRVVYRGEIQAGRFERDLETPIHLRIGNAPNVKLSYGGQAIDLRPHTQNSLATLSLVLDQSAEN